VATKRLKLLRTMDPGQIYKRFINGILIHRGRQFFENRHDAMGHIAIKGIVAAKHRYLMTFKL
jgi:hypothetical protein